MENAHITARSITLVDASGAPRIVMSTDGADGRCTISMTSVAGSNVQIDAGPGQHAGIAVSSKEFFGAVTLTSEGLTIRSKDGKLGVVVGRTFNGKDAVAVFQNGQLVWSSEQAN